MQSGRPLPAPRVELVPAAPAGEVVAPVYNEQRVLAESIRRLHDYLSEALAVSWRIVIADNGSTDATQRVAMALADDLPNVKLLALTQKGRGRALRAAWERSDAEVVCYMDVDLSTDLRALPPLLAPLFSGHSDLAIGSRLGSRARGGGGARGAVLS